MPRTRNADAIDEVEPLFIGMQPQAAPYHLGVQAVRLRGTGYNQRLNQRDVSPLRKDHNVYKAFYFPLRKVSDDVCAVFGLARDNNGVGSYRGSDSLRMPY